MTGWYILSTLTFLPLVGALFIWVIRGDDDVARRNIRATALAVTVINFLLSLLAWSSFDPASPASSLKTRSPGLAG
jgi:NADH-quinone oxidoreductase subunit M